MLRPRYVGWLVVFLFALVLEGCHFVLPPFMQNAMAVPLDVMITYSDSASTHDTWQPEMQVACGRQEADITQIIVKTEGRVIHRLTGADVHRMLQSVPDPRKVIWQVQRHSIIPVTMR